MKQMQIKWSVLRPAILLTVFICLIYSNTLNSPWQLDDFHNIVDNSAVHMTSLDGSSIKTSWYAAPNKESLQRPVSYFTFALNWYFGQDNVTGYHLVNIAIHILTACFLFATILLLFQTPNLKGRDSESIYFVALLAAVLWASHPIQIQAVTYIVQRMASLAALFYILGIFCYLKARLAASGKDKRVFFELCITAFLLAVGSKSNAIMLPIFLLLIEFTFFRDLTQKRIQKQAGAILIGAAILVAAAGFFLFLEGNPGRIFAGYENRSFTLPQRLLTQPGIVLFYLSQIFYPLPSRFSIAHDFPVATSLIAPWYTLPAILLILGLIAFALLRIRKNPVLSFAVLFFFGSHVIESTIIPLELIFEHRNYLSSLFLFIPIAIGIKKGLDYCCTASRLAFYVLVLAVCAAVIGLGSSTYARNSDWRSAKVLWENAMGKAPGSARPLLSLGRGYYEPTGQIDKAIELYEKALSLEGKTKRFKYFSYSFLARVYYSDLGDYEKAVYYSEKAIEILPDKFEINLLLCKSLAKIGRNDEATAHLENVIDRLSDSVRDLYAKGFLLLGMKKPKKALAFFRQGLEASAPTDQWQFLREIGLCHTQMNQYDKGYMFLKRARQLHPGDADLLLALADNRIRAGKPDSAGKWMKRYINAVGAENIYLELNRIAADPLGIPFSHEKTALLAAELLRARGENIIKEP